MRWSEIISEEAGVMDLAKGFIMDILAPLKSQGVDSITVKQLTDQISANPDFSGMVIDADMINQALKGINGFNVEPDPETGQMSVMIDNPQAGRQVDQKQAEKDEKNIHSAAMRALDKKDSE